MILKKQAYVRTFGCQQNVADSERIKSILLDSGYELTETAENSDIIFFNTCAVRENAENRVFGHLGELGRLKVKNKNLIICLCGCMANEETVIRKIKSSYSFVDLIFGPEKICDLKDLLNDLTKSENDFDSGKLSNENEKCEELGGEKDEYDIPNYRENKFKAFVPIMSGCNNFCSYCIVPYVRGREKSRSPQSVITEVKSLADKNYKEIMLLGQNVNSYVGDSREYNFTSLLKSINELTGNFRIRFMSSHPKDATKELIDTILSCDKICKSLHLPIQSGSNSVLDRMNRRYTTEKYLEIIDYARSLKPNFSFTSDIIVGFPNETEEEFQSTLDLIKRVRFNNLYTFIYSRRSGTVAAEIADKIPEEEKSRRMTRLWDIQKMIIEENYREFIGKTLTVLAEEVNKKGYISGRSDENVIVEFEKGDNSPENIISKFVNVKIKKARNWAVYGEIENVNQ
ncbi:MAG: tRNA (N6-isopentenyl adenosine(37)-C2)-methylthiotransferase MiaB [Ruminococcus sp.]|jgi:tRNA-2-methylthio-N6-dimethylallyladenosine synthase|nr:tRNA (N6-isopentenyl adenosine(37)-C2)-methylthiotransferase MiaB [Ruminococcus sp.]